FLFRACQALNRLKPIIKKERLLKEPLLFEIKRAGKGRGRPDAACTLPVAMEAITAAGAAAFEGGGTPSLKNAGASGRVA
ncbi:hypothetical protein, partial [Desulfovibrio sp.]|uniref:hypothetical protein n=1 Tax=Desulfovibrio sp. TaxID=885 RepID=UPI00307BF79B